MSTALILPDYIRLVERKLGGWSFKKVKMFYRQIPLAIDLNDFELLYGISDQQVAIELFRVNGGKAGFYLADLRHKHYYYCGERYEDVRPTLQQLGLSRPEPTS